MVVATQERPGRQWTLGGIVLGTLELAFGVLVLTSTADPDLLVPLVAAWGAVSGILLQAEGLRLRRLWTPRWPWRTSLVRGPWGPGCPR